jgi:alanine dehydrogenase
MIIGVPRERRADEHRVGLTPAAIELLTANGQTCVVEKDAGRGAGFSDVDYERAGARIVFSGEELYGRASLVAKVTTLTEQEAAWLQDGSVVLGFLHLAVGGRSLVETLLEKRITAVAYETVQHDDGTLPVLAALSRIAGLMTPQVAGTLLQSDRGGKGILLSGVPGVPPAEVAILGAGTFGTAAARAFTGLGASVYVLDSVPARLERIEERLGPGHQIITMAAHPHNIRKVMSFADVLIGAPYVPGQPAKVIVTREMVRLMKPRSVIMDIAIDQGGCVETSRPTTHRDPTFIAENVIHYCVPNLTSVVARAATHALTNASWAFVWGVAEHGLDAALPHVQGLKRGVATHAGSVTNAALAAHFSLPEVVL